MARVSVVTTDFARTALLDIGYEAVGSANGPAVVLLHGFPYDVRSFDGVRGLLVEHDVRIIVPYLRGFGPTRFRAESTQRSGQQAALAQDLLDLLDSLEIERAVLAGYDWGGRAACIVSALYPERVAGLVTVGGYNIQNIAEADVPAPPSAESAAWYTHYFMTERGRRGLELHRDELCELLWRQWSPTWDRASIEFAAAAPSFGNPDFVDVVIHSYRHRRGTVSGDARYESIERVLAAQPTISVPTVSLDALADGLGPDDSSTDAAFFTGRFEVRRLHGVGHNPPYERPEAVADAIVALLSP